jgi:hypothetical protein
VTRLIARYRASGALQPAHDRRHRFPQRYTRADIELLATVDEAHETLGRRVLKTGVPRARQTLSEYPFPFRGNMAPR